MSSPGAKLVGIVAAMAAIPFLSGAAVVAWLVFLASALWSLTPGKGRMYLALGALMTLVFTGLIYGLTLGSQVVVSAGGLRFRTDGALWGVTAGLRLVLFLVVAQLGRWVLPPHELLALLAGRPTLAYLVGTTVRLVPTLRRDARRIYEAQVARGHRPGRGLRRARALLPVLVPLFVGSLRRAQEQARALTLATEGARR